jgi:hypothetical protein
MQGGCHLISQAGLGHFTNDKGLINHHFYYREQLNELFWEFR